MGTLTNFRMSEQETPQAVISNLLHENTANIPENDYLRMQDALMQLNNQRGQNNDSSNDSSNENQRRIEDGYGGTATIPSNLQGELPLFVTMGRFFVMFPINLYQLLPRQIPYCMASYLIEKIKKRNEKGFKYADFEFSDEYEGDDIIDLDSMRESIIPHLQKMGFDVHLYLDDECDWDRTLCIAWEADVIPYTLSNDNIEQFSKTTDQYYQFEGDEEEEVDDEEEEQEEESDDGEEREVIL